MNEPQQKTEDELRQEVLAWAQAVQQLVTNGASAGAIAKHAAQVMASAARLLKE